MQSPGVESCDLGEGYSGAGGEKWPNPGNILEAWPIGCTDELDKGMRESGIRDGSSVMWGDGSKQGENGDLCTVRLVSSDIVPLPTLGDLFDYSTFSVYFFFFLPFQGLLPYTSFLESGRG